MKLRLVDKQKAIFLRKQGLSYKEIIATIPNLSKGTLSGWCKDIELTNAQIENLKKRTTDRMEKARLMSGIVNHKKRLNREKDIINIAKKDFLKYKNDPFFNFGIALYWAEGSKTQRMFQFMNSNPAIIKIMVQWVEKYLKIDKMELKLRLYTHSIFANEKYEEFWSNLLKIPVKNFLRTIYKQTPHNFKKNPNYKGCLRLENYKVANWLTIMSWIEYSKKLRSN